MHIGYYSPAWPPEGAANGIVTYVHQMRTALEAAGHQVSIVSPDAIHRADGAVQPIDHRPGLVARIIGRVQRALGKPDPVLPEAGEDIARAFAAVHRTIPLDLVELEESFGWCGVVQDRLPVPVVTRLHGPHFLGQCDIESGDRAAESRLREAVEGEAIRRARFITAPSATLLEATLAHYGTAAHATRFIPNPVAPASADQSWSLDRCDPDLVLCVGRFDRRKGADVAIEGFLAVLRERPTARLVMVGPSSGLQVGQEWFDFAGFCQRFVPVGLQDRIQHRGLLQPAAVAQLRLQAFVTIVCSRFENFPYSIAEAIALGCPVIATRSFGNAEMIADRQTGLLVDIAAPDQLAQALLWAFANPTATAGLGAAGQAHCRQRYAASVVAAESVEFYRTAAAQA